MNRQSLAARVKALLAKTVENGATEAEALAALAKARELMDRYQLDQGALGLEEEGTEMYRQPFSTDKHLGRIANDIKFHLASTIGDFTDTRIWRSRKDHCFKVFGLRSDTDFASYLLDHLANYIINAQASYHLQCVLDDIAPLSTAGEDSFITGAICRINERLTAMSRERHGTSTGRALIPLKNALVRRDFDRLGIHLSTSRGRYGNAADSGALAAGQRAGDRATFARPVSRSTAGLIGRS
jgi:hypothetical protein